MKKLELSKTKCKKMHFGKENFCCPQLKVHGDPMQSSNSEKYLGSLVTTDLNNKKSIQSKANMGLGIISQIMFLLSDISLGSHYFKIAKILRESMFVNGLLLSAEAWYDVTEQDIRKLEEVDESILRNILNAHSKTPIEALYLE